MLRPKSEAVLSPELRRSWSKFQRQIRNIWQRRARWKCVQTVAAMINTRTVTVITAALSLILQPSANFQLSVVVVVLTYRHFCRARRGRKCGICRWNFDAISRSSGNCVFPVWADIISLFPVVDCCRSNFSILFRSVPSGESQISRCNFNIICYSFSDNAILG